MIASGYEWICPKDGRLNKEIEAKEKVKCTKCHKTFETNPAEHAMG